MKKCFFILTIIFLFVGVIFCQDASDSNNKNSKAIEFSVGGGLTQSFILVNSYYIESTSSTKSYTFPHGMSLLFSVPISFVFFPVKYFGVGVNYDIGLDIFFRAGYHPFGISFNNKLKVVNKFGSNEKRKWFLFEYGLCSLLSSGFPGLGDYQLIISNFMFPAVYLGPSILLGFESIGLNKFGFTVGFSFDALVTQKIFENEHFIWNISDSTESIYDWLFVFGVVCRWRISFINKL